MRHEVGRNPDGDAGLEAVRRSFELACVVAFQPDGIEQKASRQLTILCELHPQGAFRSEVDDDMSRAKQLVRHGIVLQGRERALSAAFP